MNKKENTLIDESFIKKLPIPFVQILKFLDSKNCSLTLVGGIPRDYFREKKIGDDFDCEIRFAGDLKELYASIQENFSNWRYEDLSFNILRIKTNELEIELAPPRLETYQGNAPYGHSDFKVSIDSTLSFEDSFKRRDLTINAVGLEFFIDNDEIRANIVDPFGGVEDIYQNKARHCSGSFFSDPVRFLRLLRFSHKFNLIPDDSLDREIHQFDLKKLTPFYFFKEALKVPFFKFVKSFYYLTNEKKINIPEIYQELEFLKEIKTEEYFSTPDSIQLFLFFNGNSLHELEVFSNFAKLSMKKINQLFRLKESASNLVKYENIQEMLKANTLDELINSVSLNDYFKFKSLLSSWSKEELLEIFDKLKINHLEFLLDLPSSKKEVEQFIQNNSDFNQRNYAKLEFILALRSLEGL